MKSQNFSLIVIFSMALITFANFNINACTNLLVTKGASVDGSTMITYT